MKRARCELAMYLNVPWTLWSGNAANNLNSNMIYSKGVVSASLDDKGQMLPTCPQSSISISVQAMNSSTTLIVTHKFQSEQDAIKRGQCCAASAA